jgi:hypothetical protein
MIDAVDDRLTAWIRSAVGEVPVTLDPPSRVGESGAGGESGEPSVVCFLLALEEDPPTRATRGAPPHQFMLRYLVTVDGAEPKAAHRVLGELVFAALEEEELKVEFPAPGALDWRALGASPRPAVLLKVPVRRARPERPVTRVTEPLVLTASPMVAMEGSVLGPGDTPLPGARVRLPSLQLAATTDRRGRFRFPAVPAEPRVKHLEVNAKRSSLRLAAEWPRRDGDPLVIRFQTLEG